MRILLVEDNADHRELMSLALTGHDSTWEVEGVESGEEALCLLLGGEVFDLVFLDYSLPQRDGLWFLGEIRRGKAPPPVVIVTGRGDEQVAVEAMKGGAYDYVMKQEGYLVRLPVVARHAMEANRLALERKRAEVALRRSEERFQASVENFLEGFAILSCVRDSGGQLIDFRYEYINEAGCKMNQKGQEEHIGRTLLKLFPEEKEIGLFNDYVRVIETGQPLAKEYAIYESVYGGSDRLKQAFDVRIIKSEDGVVVTWQDITEKRKGQELLRQSEERLKRLIENSKDIIVMADLEGGVLYYNGPPGYGVRTEDVLGKNAFSVFEPVIAANLMNQLKLVIKGGEALTFENNIPGRGESFWFLNQMYPIRDEKGRMSTVGLIARNITERKRAEDREQLAHEVLNLLNRWESTTSTIREILLLFKKKMAFEAVGIRLRDGDDFPYFETNGFSEDFVRAERYLCAYDKEGKIVRDGKGNPVLECMCGNILCGRTDAALPFFTAGGSFWTNSTTDLLASTTGEDRQARTRNRCNGEGYESVALIPLRSGDEIIGLLQLNDRRRNQFTPEMIHFFEGVGASVGIALSRKRAEETLRTERQRLYNVLETMPIMVCLLTSDYHVAFANRAFRDKFGESHGRYCYEYCFGKKEPCDFCEAYRVLKTGQPHHWQITTLDGASVIDAYDFPFTDVDGLPMILEMDIDITERKRAEDALLESEERFRAIVENAPFGYYRVGRDGLWQYVNPLWEQMHSLSLKEIIGKPFEITQPEDSVEQAREYVKRALAGETIVGEFGRLTREGNIGYHSFNIQPVKHGKEIVAIEGFINDVTDRKRAAEKLNEANARLHMLQQITASVHSTLDLEEVFRQITDSFVYSMGYNSAVIIKRNDKKNRFEVKALSSKKWILTEVDKILGFALNNYSFPVDPGLNAAVNAAMRGEIVVAKTAEEIIYPLISKIACSMLQKLGGVKNYVLVPLQVDKEAVGGVIITSTREEVSEEELKMVNIFAQAASHAIQNANLHTLTQQAEEALRESEDRYRDLVEHSHDLICTHDLEGRILSVNRGALKNLGYDQSAIPNMNIRDILAPRVQDEFDSYLVTIKREGAASGLMMIRTITGEKRIWEYNNTLRREGVAVPIVRGMAHDVTERKRVEGRLTELNECLLSFGADPIENINRLVALCGEQLRGTCALYNRLEKGLLHSVGQWNTPPNFISVDKPDGHICFDLIQSDSSETSVIRNLQQTPYVETDPNVSCYNLKTYIGKTVSFEGTIIGSLCVVYQEDYIHSDGDKKFLGIVASAIGVEEERKRAEEALRESEERWKSLTENSPDHIMLLDLDGTILFINRTVPDLTKEEVTGTSNFKYIPPEYHQIMADCFKRVLASGRSDMYRTVYHTKEGKVRFFDVRIGPVFKNGQVVAFVSSSTDVTERKLAEEDLRRKSGEQDLLLDNIQTQIWYLTDKETYGAVNKARAEFFGKKSEEMQNKKVYDVLSKDEAEICMSGYVEVFEKRKQIHTEEWIANAKGEKRLLSINKSQKLNENGNVEYVVCSAEDITERKRDEEQLKNSTEQLRALSTHLQSIREEERTLMAREIHDELGQELTGLKMDLTWLVRRLSKNQKSLISKTESMLKLVDSTIQTVRRISSKLRPGVLDDLGLIAAIEWQAQDFENRTEITCVFSSSLEEIDLDQDRSTAVFRIFEEALTNVSRHANATRVNITLGKSADTLILRIDDNGRGIKESEVSHPKSLGLVGMRERVFVFGGEVEISGIPGKGTTVTVTIPIKKE